MNSCKILVFVMAASFAQCQTSNKQVANENLNPDFGYTINQPDKTFEMPSQLLEISGLGIAEDGNLITLNDEVGKIFKIDKNNGNVVGEYLFKADGGDFEGIEMVGKTVYAVSSKGKIYEINNYTNATTLKVDKYNTEALDKEADIEGLGYDSANQRLLLTCKAARNNPLERELWAFDLKTKTFSAKPVFSIRYQDIQAWLKLKKANADLYKEYLGDMPSEFHFGASGFAVHPQSGDYYFLSSPGKVLLVTDAKGMIKNFLKLDKKIHPQPEGITFDSAGQLYISNEGKKEATPKIYQFNVKK
jgi:uncharacterized protein YjiK